MIVKQICYYNESDKKYLNNPLDLTAENLINGYEFRDLICNEIKIKTSPDIILHINGEEVHIGEIGVYEIPIREDVEVISLKVEAKSMQYIKEHDFSFLIITFIQKEK